MKNEWRRDTSQSIFQNFQPFTSVFVSDLAAALGDGKAVSPSSYAIRLPALMTINLYVLPLNFFTNSQPALGFGRFFLAGIGSLPFSVMRILHKRFTRQHSRG